MEEGYVESSHGMADRRGQSVDGTTGFRNKPLPSSVATSDNEKKKKKKKKKEEEEKEGTRALALLQSAWFIAK